MTALLDTHVVLWATLNPSELSRKARALIVDDRNTLFVSAASAYEIANKVRKGKLEQAALLERDFMGRIAEAGFTFLPITAAEALRAGRLSGEHRDPWDRMIAAQALERDIPVLSIDSRLDVFGVRRIW